MARKKTPAELTIDIARRMADIPREEWNALIGPDTIPFLEWEWLASLEGSGSISPETGWYPLHLTLRDGGRLVGAAPLYLRTHSMGDFVFDGMWAEAAAAMKRPYYPKLVGVVPVTPAAGYRFLAAPDAGPGVVTAYLLAAAEGLCRTNKISGLHLLFADPAWAALLPPEDYLGWKHHHYLWENSGFSNFDDYLAGFTKNQRKNIRKEYARPGKQDVDVRIIPARDASEDSFRRMFELYSITNDKFIPWDARYVNEDFFLLLGKNYRDRIYFVEARHGTGGPAALEDAAPEDLIALAFLVRKGDRLWGRYWGAYEDVRDLHFTACYYLPIDWAIREGIKTFDPGAGSPHKIRRGFRAVENRSYHRFFDHALERLFRDNIDEVNRYETAAMDELNAGLPLKR
jgi:hypothetical protein